MNCDPVTDLRRLDLYYLFLWQCRRTLDDFWGPVPGVEGAKSYFDLAADDYLRSARALCPAASAPKLAGVDLSNLLARRRAAARDSIQPRMEPAIIVDAELPKDLAMSAQLAKDLPVGEAAVGLQGGQAGEGAAVPIFAKADDARKKEDQSPGVRRMGLRVEGTEWKGQYWVRGSDERLAQRPLRVAALFRGHLRGHDVSLTPLGNGTDIVWTPGPTQASVVVEGNRRNESYVIFILDYSGSMFPHLGEESAATGPVGTQPKAKPAAGDDSDRRYVLARGGLVYLLKRLAQMRNNPYRVGVMLYGHRYGWATAAINQKWGFPANNRVIGWTPEHDSLTAVDPVMVLPSEDVESLCRPNRAFTEQLATEVERVLMAQKPIGETPLYYSIKQAILELDNVRADFSQPAAPSRRIVVITDGVNWQDPRRTDRLTGKDDVAALLAQRPDIRLDVVGFLLSDKEEAVRAALQEDADQLKVDVENLVGRYRELKALVQQNGGTYTSVIDPTALGAKLVDTLRLARYKVIAEGPNMPQVEAQTVAKELRDPFEMKNLPVWNPVRIEDSERSFGRPYLAKLADSSLRAEAQVAIEGGERIELFLSDDGRRLEHRFYDVDARESRPFPHPLFAGRKLAVTVHQPLPGPDAVRFRFSVQNARAEAAAFSPRPAEAWVEVRPLGDESSKRDLYVFTDLVFEPNRPVPMLQCAAPKWPEGVQQAEARLWCKFARTPPLKEIRLDEFKDLALGGITFDRLVRFDQATQEHRVAILETGYAPGSDLNRFRVEMKPMPLKVVHSYFPQAGVVRHTFIYPASARDEPQSNYAVYLTPREKMVEGAIAVETPPLKIDIPDRPR
jgi:Mg-chelatase subunit ChlD